MKVRQIFIFAMVNNLKQKYKIGIAGNGMVGGAVLRYFQKVGARTVVYDKFKNHGSISQLNEADIIFVCVPTPYKRIGGFDLSFIEDVIKKIKGKKVVVIKSTVLPGTTEKLQKKYSRHKFLFNPEFLSEATADKDMQNPDIQVVGYTKKSRQIARDVLNLLPKAHFERILPAGEAEMVKYFHNTHGAIKVIFANQIYDLCQALKINYDDVMNTVYHSRNIQIPQYLKVWHKNFRGYGGTCFPKDMRALIWLADKLKVDFSLHKTAEKINNRLMKKQGIKDSEKMGKVERN